MESKGGIFQKIFYFRLLFRLISPFSRVANKINWRLGRKFSGEKLDVKSVQSQLFAADVILCHRDYELTNIFIGGHFTHAGMVIDDHSVVEATSNGVHVSDLNDFLKKTDDMVILRNTKIRNPALIIDRSLREIGKKYNFSFIQNPHTITCSELIFKVFDINSKYFSLKSFQNDGILTFFHQFSLHPEALLNHPDFEVRGTFSHFLYCQKFENSQKATNQNVLA